MAKRVFDTFVGWLGAALWLVVFMVACCALLVACVLSLPFIILDAIIN